MLRRQSKTHSRRSPSPYDAGRRSEVLPREKVHVTALTGTESIGMAKNLAKQVKGVDTSHQKSGGTAVVQRHGVAVLELRYNRGDDSFLARAKMHFPADQTTLPEPGDFLFEPPTSSHERIERPYVRTVRHVLG